jgi:hypothetical protein
VGAENAVTLRDLGILADQAAEPIAPQNLGISAWSRWRRTAVRRILLQRPVRPVRIVVIDVHAKDQPQVPFTCDQDPVQALAPGTAHPAFRYRVRTRRLDRGLDDPETDRSEDGVECRGEFGVPVPDQEPVATRGRTL